MSKMIAFFGIILWAIFLFAKDAGEYEQVMPEAPPAIEVIGDARPSLEDGELFIIHAGGVTPGGITESNSIEALEYTYQNGCKVIELDFCWTEDRELVCVHDWDAYYTCVGGKKAPSFQEFEQLRHGTYGFTSLTLDQLAVWLEEHDDVVIVSDIKEDCVEGAELIASRYPSVADNIWLQIYQKEEYKAASDLGFDTIIWTLYQLPFEEKLKVNEVVMFAKDNQLAALTIASELVQLVPDYVSQSAEHGVPLFVHTVNDVEEQNRYFEQGIAGIYTDFCPVKNGT